MMFRAVVLSALSVCAAGAQTDLYQRATTDFAAADFLKPAGTNRQDLAFKLAPLLLQEAAGTTNAACALDMPGSLVAHENPAGRLVFVPQPPALYVHTDIVVIKGRPHARLAYLWFYSPGAATNAHPWFTQGVRLTLNSAGHPVIWEVLIDTSAKEVIFVSQSLESAARVEFGVPSPGRRHAVEAPLEQAGNVLVARILDDASVPMGPMVYLRALNRDVLTVLCRCMPAQVKQLLRTREYELQPWPGNAARPARAAFWPGHEERPLEQRLRLPARF